MAVGLVPFDLRYTASHLWVAPGGGTVRVGLAAAAGLAATVVRSVGLAAPGARLDWGAVFGWIETREPGLVRLFTPVRGRVAEVNTALAADPDLLGRDPYGQGWLLAIELDDPGDLDFLAGGDEYSRLATTELAAHRQLPAHLQHGEEPVLLVDDFRRVVVANQVAQAEFGATARQLAHGVTCRELLGCCRSGGRLLSDSQCPVLKSLSTSEPSSQRCEVVSARGIRRQVECEVTPSSTHGRLAVVVLRPSAGAWEAAE
ncbi:MAG: hypothetical protein HZB16_21000 [Armatimonadetes bacterium]|nr:hypothetical protein [Armatimonadota bacterium]